MLRVNVSAPTRSADVWWQVRKRTAVTIAPTPLTCKRQKFNAIVNTLRAHSADVSAR